MGSKVASKQQGSRAVGKDMFMLDSDDSCSLTRQSCTDVLATVIYQKTDCMRSLSCGSTLVGYEVQRSWQSVGSGGR